MQSKALVTAIVSSLAAIGLLAAPALAQTPAVANQPLDMGGVPPSFDTPTAAFANHTMTLSVDQQQGAGAEFALKYPGGSSPVSIDASVDGLNAGASSVGFAVYDPNATSQPAETATLATNAKPGSANTMTVAYASPSSGIATFRLFNYSGSPISVSITPTTLPEPMSLTRLIDASVSASNNPDAAP